MAYTQEELVSIINTYIIDNNILAINPAKMREVLIAIATSMNTGGSSSPTARAPIFYDPFTNQFTFKSLGVAAEGTDEYTATIEGLTSLEEGYYFLATFENPNTGVARMNLNGLSDDPILKNYDTPVAAGDLTGSMFLVYDGANWVVVGSVGSGGGSVPTKTSDLINDGEDGTNKFISLLDLPSNLILYPTTVASDISGYSKMVMDIHDPYFNTTAVNVSTGSITGMAQLISSLATAAGLIDGNPGVFNITTIGNITRTAGSGTAEFFFRVYKRNLAGTETLIAESSNTIPVTNSGYSEFSATALWDDGVFLLTDRIVIKYYANRISGGSNPTYNFQFGGSSPVRSLVPIPLSVVPNNGIPLSGTISGSPITGDLELSGDGDPLGFYTGDGGDNYAKSGTNPDYYPYMENVTEGVTSSFKVQDDATYLNSANTNYRGFAGGQDFSSNLNDLDYPQKIYVDTKLNEKQSIISNFNHIGASTNILSSGTWDANIREIGNILRIDDNNLILVYTGTTIPYTHGVSEFVGLAKSSDNGLTWVKGGVLGDGKIINTPSEDPYIVKNPSNSNYHIYCEKKDSALTYKHAGIELFTSSDLITWTSQGIVLDKNVSNAWETTDVSSPTVIIENGTWKMYYEGRSYTATPNAGVVCLATSTDGISWTKSGSNPLIYGSQWSNSPIVDWSIYIVPDDIIKRNDEYFLTCHTFNGIEFVEAILVSTDGITWKDNLGTYITNQDNNNYSGDGFMFFENKLVWNDLTNIYLGKATINPYNNNVYSERTLTGDFDEIISNNKNEFIRCAITSNSTRILGRNTKSNKGVQKTIFNDSIYNLTIDLATGVLVNGSTSDIIIPKGGILNIVGTGVNSWQIFENSNLLHAIGNETKTGVLTFPSYYGFFLSDRHYIWHRPDLGGMTISTEDVTGSSLFIKDSNGYIGILKTTPSEALDVNGNGKFSGDIEITDSTKGIILKDTVLGTRHRITLVSGVLTVSTAL